MLRRRNNTIMKLISIGMIAIFALLSSEVRGNELALLAVKDIHTSAYFGRGKPFEIDPWNKVEKWGMGNFDPSEIWMTAHIDSRMTATINIKIYLKVKAGSLNKKDGASAFDAELIKKTAAWGTRRLLKNESIKVLKGINKEYLYKFILDNEISRQWKRNKWPYILDFRFEFVEPVPHKILVKTKTIYLTPKYGESY